MKSAIRYSPEVRERAVRLVFEHWWEHPSQGKAIESVASMIGCGPETLRRWVRRAEEDKAWQSMIREQQRRGIEKLQRKNAALRRSSERMRKKLFGDQPVRRRKAK